MSCQTSQPVAVKYQEVGFPEFPDPMGEVSRLESGEVVMSLDYWLKISRFVIANEAAIEKLKAQLNALSR